MPQCKLRAKSKVERQHQALQSHDSYSDAVDVLDYSQEPQKILSAVFSRSNDLNPNFL